ncbi:MAG: hypothetical protein ACYCS9_07975 [Candidatus Dormibacteria bacterium]
MLAQGLRAAEFEYATSPIWGDALVRRSALLEEGCGKLVVALVAFWYGHGRGIGSRPAAAGVTSAAIFADSDLLGRCFDAFGMGQLRPEMAIAQPFPVTHHLRVEAGRREVDLVVELGPTGLVGLEFKAGSVPGRDDAKHLFWFRDQLGAGFAAGAVVHSGPGVYELGEGVYAVPPCSLWS